MSYPAILNWRPFRPTPDSPPPSPKVDAKKVDDIPISGTKMMPISTRWADGLRGISAIFVICSHFVLTFDRGLVLPSTSTTGPTRFLQRPPFRLISQGQSFVAIFFILMGYVNSLKPIKLSRAGKVDEALSSLTVSSFRRTMRLVFPATTMTIIAWLATQFGVFELARQSDAYWLKINSPLPSSTWLWAFNDLFREIIRTWVVAENMYDQPQWALLHLLKGSMLVFVFLLATVRVTPAARISCAVCMWFWGWLAGDSLIIPNIFAGVFLAELTFVKFPKINSHHLRTFLDFLPIIMLPVSILLLCQPSSYTHLAYWSKKLQSMAEATLPPNSDLGRSIVGLGAQMLCACIMFSPTLRGMFEGPVMRWLGTQSMGLYMLHGPLMRSVLAALLFGAGWIGDWRESRRLSDSLREANQVRTGEFSEGGNDPWFSESARKEFMKWMTGGSDSTPKNPNEIPVAQTGDINMQSWEKEERVIMLPSVFACTVSTIIFVVILFIVVAWWTRKVEPRFASATAAVEAWCLPKQSQREKWISEKEQNWNQQTQRKRRDSSVEGGSSSGSESGLDETMRRSSGLPLPVTAK